MFKEIYFHGVLKSQNPRTVRQFSKVVNFCTQKYINILPFFCPQHQEGDNTQGYSKSQKLSNEMDNKGRDQWRMWAGILATIVTVPGWLKRDGGGNTNRKKMSVLMAGVVAVSLTGMLSTASSLAGSTPLYIFRMEQQSKDMNFLPTAVSGFTYTTENGSALNCNVGSFGVILGHHTSPTPTCQTCPSTCALTCPATCDDPTCPDTCVSTCPSTCDVTCDDPTCLETCEQTCRYTCTKPCIPWVLVEVSISSLIFFLFEQ